MVAVLSYRFAWVFDLLENGVFVLLLLASFQYMCRNKNQPQTFTAE